MNELLRTLGIALVVVIPAIVVAGYFVFREKPARSWHSALRHLRRAEIEFRTFNLRSGLWHFRESTRAVVDLMAKPHGVPLPQIAALQKRQMKVRDRYRELYRKVATQ
ncbi:MAG TPA: hypothetical protein VJH69_00290 [Candidatus Paceibacterota bacterium]